MNPIIPPSTSTSTEACIHCQVSVPNTTYCPNCGEKQEPVPLHTRKMLRNWWQSRIQDIRVFLHTSKDLLLNPGKVVRSYWEGPRGKYYQPVNYFVLITSMVAFVTLTFSPEVSPEEIIQKNNAMMGIDNLQPEVEPGSKAEEIQKESMKNQAALMIWVRKHFNLMMIATLPLFVLAVFLSFRKLGYGYGQQFIYGLYINGFTSLVGLPVFFFRDPLNATDPTSMINLGIGLFFYTWSFRSIYKFSWGKSLWKGIQVFLLLFGSLIVLGIVAGLLGFLVGFVGAKLGLL